MPERWTPDSWRNKPIQQVPEYPDLRALDDVEKQLRDLSAAGLRRRGAQPEEVAGARRQRPGFPATRRRLRRELRRAWRQQHPRLLPRLPADGDRAHLAGALPVVKVGRIAGQFAKPRSSPTEKRDGKELPSYRGDIINDIAFTPEARMPDPRRQMDAYRQSAATLNLLRAFAEGGYASVENVHQWMLQSVSGSPQSKAYDDLADRVSGALDFMRACGLTFAVDSALAHHRFLHQPRGAAARLRAGLHPRRFDHRRLVRDLRPHAVDRRPHAAIRPRPCRILRAASRIRSA